MVLGKILIAFSVMFVCTLIHAFFMAFADRALDRRLAQLGSGPHPFHRGVLIWLLIMWMFLGICVQAGLWGMIYMSQPAITELPDAQTAFYFSMVTYTSLGYGDIVLTGQWRALSAIQAANGVIIFGWTTALIFYFIQRIFRARMPREEP